MCVTEDPLEDPTRPLGKAYLDAGNNRRSR
jgi:hypothetical protein